MLVTISQFRDTAFAGSGHSLPLGRNRMGSEARTTDGAFAALSTDTKFIRLATDTGIRMEIDGGANGSHSEFFPAGSVEFMAVNGGEVFNITTA